MLSKELNIFLLLCLVLDTSNRNYKKIVYVDQNIKLNEAIDQNNKYYKKQSTKASFNDWQECIKDFLGQLFNT